MPCPKCLDLTSSVFICLFPVHRGEMVPQFYSLGDGSHLTATLPFAVVVAQCVKCVSCGCFVPSPCQQAVLPCLPLRFLFCPSLGWHKAVSQVSVVLLHAPRPHLEAGSLSKWTQGSRVPLSPFPACSGWDTSWAGRTRKSHSCDPFVAFSLACLYSCSLISLSLKVCGFLFVLF